MARQLSELTGDEREFCAEYHLATLTTTLPNGALHVVPVGFTVDWDNAVVRVICSADSQKALNARQNSEAGICTVDGGRWLSFFGRPHVTTEATAVASAVKAYAARYRDPRPNANRAVIEIAVDRVLGNASPLRQRSGAVIRE
jgi:hypothetical protein